MRIKRKGLLFRTFFPRVFLGTAVLLMRCKNVVVGVLRITCRSQCRRVFRVLADVCVFCRWCYTMFLLYVWWRVGVELIYPWFVVGAFLQFL